MIGSSFYAPIITSLSAGALGLYYLTLTMRVIRFRVKNEIYIGKHSNKKVEEKLEIEFEQACRAHGNFSEYVPLQLVLFGLIETQGVIPAYLYPRLILGVWQALFVAGRFVHVEFGLRQNKALGWGRKKGMQITLYSLAASSILLIGNSVVSVLF